MICEAAICHCSVPSSGLQDMPTLFMSDLQVSCLQHLCSVHVNSILRFFYGVNLSHIWAPSFPTVLNFLYRSCLRVMHLTHDRFSFIIFAFTESSGTIWSRNHLWIFVVVYGICKALSCTIFKLVILFLVSFIHCSAFTLEQSVDNQDGGLQVDVLTLNYLFYFLHCCSSESRSSFFLAAVSSWIDGWIKAYNIFYNLNFFIIRFKVV